MRFLSLKLKNFLRVGDKPIEFNLDKKGLILIVGKNGHGKSTLLDGISFALTGKPVRQTPPGKLVNNINKKDMWASIDVEAFDMLIRIKRGQKPGFLKLWIKPINDARDVESQEFSRTKNIDETQLEIERLFRFNNQLFCCMVVNSTRRPSFFQAASSEQKDITENLFGFSSLTAKADDIKRSRQLDESSLVTLKALIEQSMSTREKVLKQIQSEKIISERWENDRSIKIDSLRSRINELSDIDFEKEILLAQEKIDRDIEINAWSVKAANTQKSIDNAKRQRDARLADIRIQLKNAVVDYDENDFLISEEVIKIITESEKHIAELKNEKKFLEKETRDTKTRITNIEDELKNIEDCCSTCNRPWPNIDELISVRNELISELETLKNTSADQDLLLNSLQEKIRGFESNMIEAKSVKPRFTDQITLSVAKEKLKNSESIINRLNSDATKTTEEFDSFIASLTLDKRPDEVSGSLFGDVVELRDKRDLRHKKQHELDSLLGSINPHLNSIKLLNDALPDEPDTAKIQELEKNIGHKLFLERLLVRKDSPIRTAVLDRYLPYLNQRIAYYLNRLELPYNISFGGDLEVSVFDSGNEIDASAISGGESERLSMAIAWAFRDVYEEINGFSISFSAIDERLDSGLDAGGADAAIKILSEMSTKRDGALWIVTHRSEFIDYADEVVTVERTNRFTEYKQQVSS